MDMENLVPRKKTIRVSYCDPDATDSSSDEGSDKSHENSKRKVHEIEVEFVPKNQSPRSDSGNFEEERGFKKPNPTSDGEKIIGVRMMKTGKFGAEIQDPFNNKRLVWLGTFGTAEAASRAYLAKESKFAAVKLRAKQRLEWASENSPFQDSVPSVLNSDDPNPTGVGKEMVGVRMTKRGNFGSSIKDPFKKKKVWLGSFTTAEEASRAYLAKKAQFAAKKPKPKRRIVRVASDKSTFQDYVSSVVDKDTSDLTSFQEGARTRISGFRRRNLGNFCEEIRNPITKRRVWLGTFGTTERASRAYFSEKAQFAAEQLRAKRRIDRVASDKSTIQNSASSFHEGARTRISGVRRRHSGKFCAEITNPITKKRVWIGSFATEEEASRAYLSKEAEFEDELRAKQGFGRVASEKSLAPDYVSSVLEMETSDLSNETGVALSAVDQDAEFGYFNGVQVLDKNGFFVGEFSMLDDFSICSEEEAANS
ncbi:uncharacterized protein [Primulina eburnea]|uniref:uncharacterized protein n=1 Tax=Primulina eburnea TaxID=1245227 RepID=UPI003C6C0CC6